MDRITVACFIVALIGILLWGCQRKGNTTAEDPTVVALTRTGSEALNIHARLACSYRYFSSEQDHPLVGIHGVWQVSDSSVQFGLGGLAFAVGSESLRTEPGGFIYGIYVEWTGGERWDYGGVGRVTMTALTPRTIGTFAFTSDRDSTIVLNGYFNVPYAGAPQAESSTRLSFTSSNTSEIPSVLTHLAFSYLNFYQYHRFGPTLTVWGIQQDDTSCTMLTLYGLPNRTGLSSFGSSDPPHEWLTNSRLGDSTRLVDWVPGSINLTAIWPVTRGTFQFSDSARGISITDGQFDVPYAGAP